MRTIRSTLSEQMVRKGETPKVSTFLQAPQSTGPNGGGTGMDLRRQQRRAKIQLCRLGQESGPGPPPATPRSSTKMKMGSRAILSTAPSTTVPMPRPERPWQMRKLLRPVAMRAKAVPAI